MEKLSYDGPVVLAVLDGVGLAPDAPGNAVSKARTTFLGRAARDYLHIALNASGEAVGLTPGQMGNSEVGHNTMGAGRAVRQGIAHVNECFDNGEIFRSDAWKGAIEFVKNGCGAADGGANAGADVGAADSDEAAGRADIKSGENRVELDKSGKVCYNEGMSTLHFAGIFSDGGVHSDIAHLMKMIEQAYREGVRRMRVHAVFDGRDVGPFSALVYVEKFENFAKKFPDADIQIASGGGRMVAVADRYESDWQIVARGWDMMVNGVADYYFRSADEAVRTLRRLFPEVQDQNLPPFVIEGDDGKPVGKVKKGDAFIYFDFRADRAIEIAQAFTYWDFPYFSRGEYKPDDVYFAGMTEYNSDTHVPEHQLVAPVVFEGTLGRFLGERGVSQLAVSETVKFGHITYYFNGNSYEKANGEEFVEIESYSEPFETRPWMRSAEIADAVVERMPDYRFVRLNFPGGDMVGHTADMEATIVAMEAIDLALARVAARVDELGGVLIIVADHGNAEELLDADGNKKTSHTSNKVPCIIYDNTANREHYEVAGVINPGLANLAATVAVMLGLEDYPEGWAEPLVKVK